MENSAWQSQPQLTTPGRAHNEDSKVPGRLDETGTLAELPGIGGAAPGQFRFDWAVPTIEGAKEAPGGRGGHSGTLVGGRIFVFGGHYLSGKNFQYSNELFVLDVDHNRWTKPRTRGAPPQGRYNHGACLVGEKIYIFGGKTETESLRDMHTLNVNTLAYDETPAQIKNSTTVGLPAARHGHSMNVFDGNKIVLFGGTNDKKFFNDVRIYDSLTHTWCCVDDGRGEAGASVQPRALHAAAVVGDYLVIHGGIAKGGAYLGDVKVFHLRNYVWSRLRVSGVPPSSRYGHSCSLSPAGALVFVGGWQGLPYRCDVCGAFNARVPEQHREFCALKKRKITVAEKPGAEYVHYLDLHSQTWCAVQSPGEATASRYGHSAVGVGPHLVVVGGWDGNKALADVAVLRNNA